MDKNKTTQSTSTWEELFHGMWNFLTEEDAEITYEFDHLHIQVPFQGTKKSEHADWILDGELKVSSKRKG